MSDTIESVGVIDTREGISFPWNLQVGSTEIAFSSPMFSSKPFLHCIDSLHNDQIPTMKVYKVTYCKNNDTHDNISTPCFQTHNFKPFIRLDWLQTNSLIFEWQAQITSNVTFIFLEDIYYNFITK